MTEGRVVITGMGVVSAVGKTKDELWQSILSGHSGIGPITLLDTGALKFHHGAEVLGFDATHAFSSNKLTQLDRFSQLQIVAAREALADAGLSPGELPERTAVLTGSSLGGKMTEDEQYRVLYRENRARVPPLLIPRAMANAGASQLSIEMGIMGPGLTLSTACSSSAHAIGLAFWLLRHGKADVALAGGSEAPFSWGHLKAWEALRVVAPDTCRPFSKDRKGMILGEGGAALVLESLPSALERRAHIHAEMVGFGMSSDAGHITQPNPEGAARALREALGDGGLSPADVDYVNAHGTGTPANDPAETLALYQVFGERARRLPVSSTKSMHGHTLGAAGAIEAVITVLALRHGVLPPTANFTERDPDCDLDVVPNEARPANIRCALSSSFAFGGLNAVLVFRRFKG